MKSVYEQITQVKENVETCLRQIESCLADFRSGGVDCDTELWLYHAANRLEKEGEILRGLAQDFADQEKGGAE